ncbi:sugar transferase [Limosilactobacillus caviae]|uniref:Capsular polysaccharide biosynthesis protein n=1 Tax=Limosilactobacillus caviae TaxID=1769424 RepID=A0ABQ2C7J7_9LACO|nr:sugar transferase [Limosilactobacillus caviae]MCD7124517.1 sugar transferase [Limosilactobacillus caviae]MRH47257.1 sugar transferase [Limosilactobacillus reuteri]GGI64272.1 capsular polysaccharide biosynthesis protein [Limosilactobacillus caviae]
MQATVEEKNDSLEYSFINKIGAPVPKAKLIGKRIFDIIFGIIFGIISLPIILVFGILVKLTSKGPVFFKQERVGYMGKPIVITKLRSMRNDAEKKTGAVWAKKDDPRVTAVGKFMRRTRVDELPQFWSIIKGDMSLVGPRPERFVLTEEFSEEWPDFPQRLRIIPGLTGYAQIHGGYDLKPNEKCKLDNYYIDHYSLGFDFKIAFETFKILFTGNGAR